MTTHCTVRSSHHSLRKELMHIIAKSGCELAYVHRYKYTIFFTTTSLDSIAYRSQINTARSANMKDGLVLSTWKVLYHDHVSEKS